MKIKVVLGYSIFALLFGGLLIFLISCSIHFGILIPILIVFGITLGIIGVAFLAFWLISSGE